MSVLEPVATEQITSTTKPEPSPHNHQSPPDEPLVIIEPSRSWVAINIRDLWVYRELLYFLTWRDIKVRYKQTVLGAAWAIIQPLFAMIIFTLFFGKLAGIASDNIPYPIFAYSGLLPWTFLSAAINNSSNSLIGTDSRLITKVYFPRMIIPCAAVSAGLIDLAIASLILFGMLAYYHIAITASLLLLPFIIVLLTLLAIGIGMWTSALNVKYRDVRYALPFFIQLWMFSSPIIYPSSLIPQKWRWLYNLNPLVGIVEAFRDSFFGKEINWSALAISTVITLTILISSAYAFRRLEKSFADIL
ncbi:MAG: phosphate ABC transporter permease [Acidobacteria bacterium 13_1_20CM_3_53_8]|nr:MAG: phosphate ABC transporter permease [Acidobacteria bacterium 13_1_20CM_3_53_8]